MVVYMDLDSPESIEVTCLLLGRVIVDVVLAEATSIQLCDRSCILDLGVTRVCTRVSKATRSVLEAPQWLIWTVLTYMIHAEC